MFISYIKDFFYKTVSKPDEMAYLDDNYYAPLFDDNDELPIDIYIAKNKERKKRKLIIPKWIGRIIVWKGMHKKLSRWGRRKGQYVVDYVLEQTIEKFVEKTDKNDSDVEITDKELADSIIKELETNVYLDELDPELDDII